MAANVNLDYIPETKEEFLNRSFEHSRALWEVAYNILYGPGYLLRRGFGKPSQLLQGTQDFVTWCNAMHVRNPLAILRCVGHPDAEKNPYQKPILDTLGPCNGLGDSKTVTLYLCVGGSLTVRKYKAERREGSESIHLVLDQPEAIEAVTNEVLLSTLDERRTAEDWDDQPEELKRKVGSLIKTLSKLTSAEEEQEPSRGR